MDWQSVHISYRQQPATRFSFLELSETFCCIFRLIQSDKTFAVFGFGKLLFFHIFPQRFWFHTTGRIFPRLLNISPLQILFCGPFQSVLVVVCAAYENPPRRSNRPRESLTHSAGEIHGGELGGGGLSFLVACVAFQFHNSNDLVIVEEKQILGDLEGNGSWPPP